MGNSAQTDPAVSSDSVAIDLRFVLITNAELSATFAPNSIYSVPNVRSKL